MSENLSNSNWSVFAYHVDEKTDVILAVSFHRAGVGPEDEGDFVEIPKTLLMLDVTGIAPLETIVPREIIQQAMMTLKQRATRSYNA